MTEPNIVRISGNPTEEEIAAITAVVSTYISNLAALPVDNSEAKELSWVDAYRQKSRSTELLSGKITNWTARHRVRFR